MRNILNYITFNCIKIHLIVLFLKAIASLEVMSKMVKDSCLR